MAGGYILPNGEFQEEVSVTAPKPLPVDSVCGSAASSEPIPQDTVEQTETN